MRFGSLLFLFFLFLSCEKSTVDLDITVLFTDHSYSITSIYEEDNELSYIGGDTWAEGIIGSIDTGFVINSSADSVFNCILLDRASTSEHSYYCGIDGFLRCDDMECYVSRTQSLEILRSIVAHESGVIVVGGAGFDQGIMYRYDPNLQLDSFYYFPFVMESIIRVDEERLMVFGFGAAMLSDNNGVDWRFMDLEGGHFVKARQLQEKLYVITSDAKLFVCQAHSDSPQWRLESDLDIDQVQDMDVNADGQIVIVSAHGELRVSKDFGSTWQAYNLNGTTLRSCYIDGLSHVYLGGDHGYLARFVVN